MQAVDSQPADLRVSEVSNIADMRSIETLFSEIWGKDRLPVASDLLQALRLNGNYVAAAFLGTELVGAIFGFLGGLDGHGMHLHSHILGVHPDAQVRGVGFALKQHQRGWALAHGIETVTWTFDPLVRRNAYFNLTKLGAGIAQYHRNFYDSMGDRINGDGESDRVLAQWELRSARANDASSGVSHEPLVDELRAGGALTVLRAVHDAPVLASISGDVILLEIPLDIVSLRRTRPDVAAAWPTALRSTLAEALATGWKVIGINRSGVYVLRRGAGAVASAP